MPEAYDVVVAGGGVAGAAAALTATQCGASVLLLEKSAELGGSCAYSGGNLLHLEGPDSLAHLRDLAFNKTPEDVLAGYLEGLRSLKSWLVGLGAELTEAARLHRCWPNFPGSAAVSYYRVAGPDGGGVALWRLLEDTLAASTVDVRVNSPVERLIEADGRVVGVMADGARYDARAGVVLATGGFENSDELCDTYLPLTPLLAVGGRGGNDGDALHLAVDIGAALWHMSTFFGFWAFQPDDCARPFAILPFAPSSFIVDSDGRRFHSEIGREPHDLMRSVGDYFPGNPNRPHLPAYLILDDAAAEVGPLSPFPNANAYSWSTDNRAEISRWAVSAADPKDLADRLGMNPDIFGATAQGFNAAASAGRDAMFHRAPSSMASLSGTLHALRIWPGVASTSGGPRRDRHGQVLRRDASPIEGLYAAGSAGSVWGQFTEHGGGLTDGLVFGARAARHALGIADRPQ